jgi:hypothetical protein
MLFGYETFLAQGNQYQAHHTAFTAQTLTAKLREAGFSKVDVERENWTLVAQGVK